MLSVIAKLLWMWFSNFLRNVSWVPSHVDMEPLCQKEVSTPMFLIIMQIFAVTRGRTDWRCPLTLNSHSKQQFQGLLVSDRLTLITLNYVEIYDIRFFAHASYYSDITYINLFASMHFLVEIKDCGILFWNELLFLRRGFNGSICFFQYCFVLK